MNSRPIPSLLLSPTPAPPDPPVCNSKHPFQSSTAKRQHRRMRSLVLVGSDLLHLISQPSRYSSLLCRESSMTISEIVESHSVVRFIVTSRQASTNVRNDEGFLCVCNAE
jgi:hypothetical protein